ncbi:hypothetical protein B0H11DRAFT_2203535 [Mycena galericulata]|nr:hypothetical protein B0H11DRAFT_2203535 [Mycena galericulata]
MSSREIGCICGVSGHQKSATDAQPERTAAADNIPISMAARSIITRSTDNDPRPRTQPYRSYHRSSPSNPSENFDTGGSGRLDIIPRYHENSLRAALVGRWIDMGNCGTINPRRIAPNPSAYRGNSASPTKCGAHLNAPTEWATLQPVSGAKRSRRCVSPEREVRNNARLARGLPLDETEMFPSISTADWSSFPEIEEWAKGGENHGAHDASEADVVYMKMLDVFATPSAARNASGGQASFTNLKTRKILNSVGPTLQGDGTPVRGCLSGGSVVEYFLMPEDFSRPYFPPRIFDVWPQPTLRTFWYSITARPTNETTRYHKWNIEVRRLSVLNHMSVYTDLSNLSLATMAAPRFDDKDDTNLVEFCAHPARLLADRNSLYKLLGPQGKFPWSFRHNAAAWKRRSGVIVNFDGRVLAAARERSARQSDASVGEEEEDQEEEQEDELEEEEEGEADYTPTPPPRFRKMSVAAPKKTPRTIVAKQDDVLDNLLLALTSVVESAGVLRQRMKEDSSEGEEEEEEEEGQLKAKLIKVMPAAKRKTAARTPPEYEEDDEEEPVPSTKVKAVVVKAPRKLPVGKQASKAPTKPSTTTTPAPPKPPQKAAAKPVFKPVVEVVMKKRKKNLEDSPDDEVRPKKKRSAYYPGVALTPIQPASQAELAIAGHGTTGRTEKGNPSEFALFIF